MKIQRYIIYICMAAMAIASSCSGDKLTKVPQSGVATYEVHYSQELKGDGMVSMFYPKVLESRFNENGIRFVAEGALGLASVNIVTTTENGFVTIDIDKKRFMMSPAEYFGNQMAQDVVSQAEVSYGDEEVEVQGWMSKSMHAVHTTPMGKVVIDAFYVPVEKTQKLANVPVDIPGLVTAMSIKMGDYNVMFSLSDIREENIEDSEFTEPKGYQRVTFPEMIAEIGQLMQ